MSQNPVAGTQHRPLHGGYPDSRGSLHGSPASLARLPSVAGHFFHPDCTYPHCNCNTQFKCRFKAPIKAGPIVKAVKMCIEIDLAHEQAHGPSDNPRHTCGAWWGTGAFDTGAITAATYAEHLAHLPDIEEAAT